MKKINFLIPALAMSVLAPTIALTSCGTQQSADEPLLMKQFENHPTYQKCYIHRYTGTVQDGTKITCKCNYTKGLLSGVADFFVVTDEFDRGTKQPCLNVGDFKITEIIDGVSHNINVEDKTGEHNAITTTNFIATSNATVLIEFNTHMTLIEPIFVFE